MGLARDRDLALFHGFEQGRLHLGRRAVDFVGEHQVGEDGAGAEIQRARAGAVLGQHFGAGDVRRQQVGRELDARKVAVQVLRQRLDRARLGEPGQPLDQDVAIRQETEDEALDDVLLPDDRAPHPGDERLDLSERVHGVPSGSPVR